MAGLELLEIGGDTSIRAFQNELRWNDMYYQHCGN